VVHEHLGAKRSIASIVYEDQAWRTKVFGHTHTDRTTPSIEKQLPLTEISFAAAVQAKDFFEYAAAGTSIFASIAALRVRQHRQEHNVPFATLESAHIAAFNLPLCTLTM
jgi:hypothetical protein